MIKRTITYTTFDDQTITEDFYFHLSKVELFEFEVGYEGGLAGFIRRAGGSNDNKAMFAEFKRIVLHAYGKRSSDGKSFLKSEEATKAFEHSAAFDVLLMEFLTGGDQEIANFVIGILPKDMAEPLSNNVGQATMNLEDLKNLQEKIAGENPKPMSTIPPPPPVGHQPPMPGEGL